MSAKEGFSYGIALYNAAALLNHSCQPNCVLRKTPDAVHQGHTGSLNETASRSKWNEFVNALALTFERNREQVSLFFVKNSCWNRINHQLHQFEGTITVSYKVCLLLWGCYINLTTTWTIVVALGGSFGKVVALLVLSLWMSFLLWSDLSRRVLCFKWHLCIYYYYYYWYIYIYICLLQIPLQTELCLPTQRMFWF